MLRILGFVFEMLKILSFVFEMIRILAVVPPPPLHDRRHPFWQIGHNPWSSTSEVGYIHGTGERRTVDPQGEQAMRPTTRHHLRRMAHGTLYATTMTMCASLMGTVAVILGLGLNPTIWYCERLSAQMCVWCVIEAIIVLPLVAAGGLHSRPRSNSL